jgi:hypothetical protein
MKGKDTERLAGVLEPCPALVHLDLNGNRFVGAAGAERLAGVLGQCRELVHLNLSGNKVGGGGAESLAGVLLQCPALDHLDLSRAGSPFFFILFFPPHLLFVLGIFFGESKVGHPGMLHVHEQDASHSMQDAMTHLDLTSADSPRSQSRSQTLSQPRSQSRSQTRSQSRD